MDSHPAPDLTSGISWLICFTQNWELKNPNKWFNVIRIPWQYFQIVWLRRLCTWSKTTINPVWIRLVSFTLVSGLWRSGSAPRDLCSEFPRLELSPTHKPRGTDLMILNAEFHLCLTVILDFILNRILHSMTMKWIILLSYSKRVLFDFVNYSK